jgi:hypothetical protein
MQNLPTTNATVTNTSTTGASVSASSLPTARIEGLWVRLVFPWSLDSIWAYQSIVKSNTEITNV